MKARTLILLALALGLALFIVLVERKMPTTQEREEQKKKIFSVKEEEITGLKYAAPDFSWEAKKQGDKWRLVAPMDYPADEGTLSGILSSIANLEREKELEAGADLAALDLKPAKTVVTFTTAQGPVSLTLGAALPGVGNLAVQRMDTGRGYLIAPGFSSALKKSLTELRSKEIFSVDASQAAVIELRKGDRTTTLRKGPDGWMLDFPFPDRAQREGVDDLLFGFTGLRAKDFVDTVDEAKLKALGLDPPYARIAFYDKDKKALLEASVGRPKDLGKDEFYVLRGRQVFLTSHSLWEKLEQGTLAFPDPKLLGLKRWEVDRIETTLGTDKRVLERKEGEWWADGKKIAATGSVDDFLDHLAALQWMENYKTPKTGPVEIRMIITSGKAKTEAEFLKDASDPRFWWAKVSERPFWWKLEDAKVASLKEDLDRIKPAPPEPAPPPSAPKKP